MSRFCLSAQLRGEQPSYLKGDNFFKFICSDCSEDAKESFERMRLTWQQVNRRRLPTAVEAETRLAAGKLPLLVCLRW